MTTGNQYQKAQTLLKPLIEGLDPETGEELPKDAIVNRIEVNRALHVALLALEQMQLRLQRRAQLPPGVGKSWTAEEENQLLQEVADNTPFEEIAKAHGRTLRAIEARAARMGLLEPGQRVSIDPLGIQSGGTDKDDNEKDNSGRDQ